MQVKNQEEDDRSELHQSALRRSIYARIFRRDWANMFDFSGGQLPSDIIEVIYKDFLSPVDHAYLDMTCKTANERRPWGLTDIPLPLVKMLTEIITSSSGNEYHNTVTALSDISNTTTIVMEIFTPHMLKKCKFVGWNIDTGLPDLDLTSDVSRCQVSMMRQQTTDNNKTMIHNEKRRAFNLILAVALVPPVLYSVLDNTHHGNVIDIQFMVSYFQAVYLHCGLDTTYLVDNLEKSLDFEVWKKFSLSEFWNCTPAYIDVSRKILMSAWSKSILDRQLLFLASDDYCPSRIYYFMKFPLKTLFDYFSKFRFPIDLIVRVMKYVEPDMNVKEEYGLIIPNAQFHKNDWWHTYTIIFPEDNLDIRRHIEDFDYAVDTFELPNDVLLFHLSNYVYDENVLEHFVSGKNNGRFLETSTTLQAFIFRVVQHELPTDKLINKMNWLLKHTSCSETDFATFFIDCEYRHLETKPERGYHAINRYSDTMKALIRCLYKNKSTDFIKGVKRRIRDNESYGYYR